MSISKYWLLTKYRFMADNSNKCYTTQPSLIKASRLTDIKEVIICNKKCENNFTVQYFYRYNYMPWFFQFGCKFTVDRQVVCVPIMYKLGIDYSHTFLTSLHSICTCVQSKQHVFHWLHPVAVFHIVFRSLFCHTSKIIKPLFFFVLIVYHYIMLVH